MGCLFFKFICCHKSAKCNNWIKNKRVSGFGVFYDETSRYGCENSPKTLKHPAPSLEILSAKDWIFSLLNAGNSVDYGVHECSTKRTKKEKVHEWFISLKDIECAWDQAESLQKTPHEQPATSRSVLKEPKCNSISHDAIQDFEVPWKKNKSFDNLQFSRRHIVSGFENLLKSDRVQNFEATVDVQKCQGQRIGFVVICSYSLEKRCFFVL